MIVAPELSRTERNRAPETEPRSGVVRAPAPEERCRGGCDDGLRALRMRRRVG